MQIVRVGIGVAILKNNNILLGKRKNAHGASTWAFPGGHLEFGESFEACAEREVREETNLSITNIRLGTCTNTMFESAKKHYVTIIMVADYAAGVLQAMEPDKCDHWEWFSWNQLPQPLFDPITQIIHSGFNPNFERFY